MDKINMSKIDELRNEYESVSMSKEAYEKMRERMEMAKQEKNKQINFAEKKVNMKGFKWVVAAAVCAALILPNTSPVIANAMENIPVVGGFFRLVTVRHFDYEDDKKTADINVPEVVIDSEKQENTDVAVNEKTQATVDNINNEIQALADKYIKEFEENAKNNGYEEVKVKSEIVNTTDKYFTLKLTYVYTAADGYEENHYYTIDLGTGKRVKLADIYTNQENYIAKLQENIEKQMREQMAADEMIHYWLDDEDMTEQDFDLKELIKNAECYINNEGNTVICFNQGDVAPMYMGVVEFEIK